MSGSLASLRVATWNVEHRTAPARLISAMKSHPDLARVDVWAWQEIGRDARAAEVAAGLGLHLAYRHGVAIASRWPLGEVAVMNLPIAPLPWNRRQRVALAATVGSVRVVTVHLDTRINLDARLGQLAPALADPHPRLIVGGDLNTLPFHFAGGAVPVWPVDQAARVDAHLRARGFDATAREAGPTHRTRLRLDGIFTRGFAPARATVVRGVRISDHFPLYVDLDVAPDAAP